MTKQIPASPRSLRGPLQHRTVSASVAEELRRRIVDGEFQAGFQLRQEALAAEFGVSRIPLREALVQLEAEGLVKIHPHRGAIVSALSPQEVEELFDLRALLEPRLLEVLAPLLTEADYRRLKDILEEYSSELNAMHVSRWGELNREFHLVLYRHAGQPRSLSIVANLLQECDRHTRLQLALTNGRARAEAEHEKLLDLCIQGDIKAACHLLKSHIDNAGKALLEYIRKHQKEGATRSE